MRQVCGVLAVLALLASTTEVLATGAAWTKNGIGVYDYTSAPWRPLVESTVAEFNAMLPARAPRLVYQPMGEVPCSQISAQLHRGGITVCTAPSLPANAELGEAQFSVNKGQLSRVRITLSEASAPQLRDTTVCHEFMHATTGIPDNYGALPESSCVWGNLTAPGAFDARYAHKVYQKHDDAASSEGKHRKGKKGGGRGR
jgi:hypothetical protein